MAPVDARASKNSHHLVKKLHHGVEIGSLKHRVGEFVESRNMEILIIVLVLCDVLLLGVEHGIDAHFLCIGGEKARMAPNDLVEISKTHGSPGAHLLQTESWFDELAHPGAPSLALRSGGGAVFGAGPLSFLQQPDGITRGPRVLPHRTPPRGSIPLDDLSPAAGPPYKASAHGALAPAQAHAEAHAAAAGHGRHEAPAHGGHGAASAEASKPHTPAGGHGHHQPDEAIVCETRNGVVSHEIEHFCHQASIVILSIFMVEILLKMWMSPKDFFGNPVEVLDLVVVSLSLFVDIFIIPMIHDVKKKSQMEIVVGLLIMCRFWRVVRIFHGLFEVVHHQAEHEDKMNLQIEALAAELAQLTQEPKEQVLARTHVSARDVSVHHKDED